MNNKRIFVIGLIWDMIVSIRKLEDVPVANKSKRILIIKIIVHD